MKIIDRILEKAKKKSDAAEVFFASAEVTSCEWSSDKLKMATANESSGIALRVFIRGKTGFFATSKIGDPDLIVNSACELAPLGSDFAGELPDRFCPSDIETFDEETSRIEVGRLVDVGNRMVAAAKEGNSEALYDGKITRLVINTAIANSNGASANFRKSGFNGHLDRSRARAMSLCCGNPITIHGSGINRNDGRKTLLKNSTWQKKSSKFPQANINASLYPKRWRCSALFFSP
jgi:predicted Zn-dependent protease